MAINKNPSHDSASLILGAGLLLPGLLLLAWMTVPRAGNLIPPLALVGASFLDMLNDGSLAANLALSLPRLLSGFLIGGLAGFGLGLVMGMSHRMEQIFGGSFHAIRQVPLVGWIPVVILWFGIGELSKTIFVALGAFYPMVLNTFSGIRNVPLAYVELARSQNFTRMDLVRKIILPAALPSIRTGSLLAINMSWIFVVVAETLTETNGGLATLLSIGRDTLRMDLIVIGILLTGISGFSFNVMLRGLWALALIHRPDLHRLSTKGA